MKDYKTIMEDLSPIFNFEDEKAQLEVTLFKKFIRVRFKDKVITSVFSKRGLFK